MTFPYRFQLLGPVRAWHGDTELDVGSPQQRAVLALLLLGNGSPVSTTSLISSLWPDNPPQTSLKAIRSYIYRLRSALVSDSSAELQDTGELIDQHISKHSPRRFSLIETVGDSYLLRVDRRNYDVGLFRRDLDAAEGARRLGNHQQAHELTLSALCLWQSVPLAGLPDAVARPHRSALVTLHRAATEATILERLRRGEETQASVQLTHALAEDPTDERFRALLMLALYRNARQAEALRTYDDGRILLAERLGMDPGAALQSMRQKILVADPDLMTVDATGIMHSSAGVIRRTVSDPSTAPRQLPPDPAAFYGRENELSALHELVQNSSGRRFVIITGTAGVGKTALALRWAHQGAAVFPDGQIYIQLDGPGSATADSLTDLAVRQVLHALGTLPAATPIDLTGRLSLLRGLLATRRVLILADNVSDASQLQPFIPTSQASMLIATSRTALASTVARNDAFTLHLDLLNDQRASELLASKLGAQRLAAEPAATQRLLRRCAGLPLALTILAARITGRPATTLRHVADELDSYPQPLQGFALPDTNLDIREVLSWSYRALSPPAAHLFRLLSANPSADTTAAGARDLAGTSLPATYGLLDELRQANMLVEHASGRYKTHDVLRAYAAELHELEDSDTERQAAIERFFSGFLNRAHQAALALAPYDIPAESADTTPRYNLNDTKVDDVADAMDWFTAELPGLPSLIRTAAGVDDPRTWRIAWAFDRFLDRTGRWVDHRDLQRLALECATRNHDDLGQAYAHRGLARANANLGDHDRARNHIDQALRLFSHRNLDLALIDTHRQASWIAEQADDLHAASAHANAALKLTGQTAVPTAIRAAALNAVGWYHTRQGQHSVALDFCKQAIELVHDTNADYPLADVWDSIGHAQHHLGAYDEAINAYSNALRLYASLGVAYGEADTADRLGDTLTAAAQTSEANALWRRSAEVFQQLRHPREHQVRAKLDHPS